MESSSYPPALAPNLIDTHRAAVGEGRWLKFVPASGAATRMFAVASTEDKRRFREARDQFAFADDVRRWFTAQGIDLSDQSFTAGENEVVEAVISTPGLDFGRLPKGLVKFHAYPGEARTPFEEHLLEAQAGLGGDGNALEAHFTVGGEHVELFAAQLQEFASRRESAQLMLAFPSNTHRPTPSLWTTRGDSYATNRGGPSCARGVTAR